MKKIEFEYDITIRVKFEKEEFELLLKAFDDPMNRSYKERYVTPGVGAFMNANKNYFSDDGILRFTDRQIDTCCKVLELASMGYTMKNSKDELYFPEKVKFVELYDKIFDLHKLINEEYERICSKTWNKDELIIILAMYKTHMKDGGVVLQVDEWVEQNREILHF